jgi:hypothetical protein
MRSEKEFERLLTRALAQKAEPDADIQRKVLAHWKEKQNMDKKKWSVAVAAAACVLMTTVSVGATTHYLTNRDIVPETESTETVSQVSTTLTTNMSNEYVTYIQSGAWKDDIADAELVSSSDSVEKEENGSYKFTYSEESDGVSSQATDCIFDNEFVDNIAVRNTEFSYAPSDGSMTLYIVAEKNDDGTANIKLYKKK